MGAESPSAETDKTLSPERPAACSAGRVLSAFRHAPLGALVSTPAFPARSGFETSSDARIAVPGQGIFCYCSRQEFSCRCWHGGPTHDCSRDLLALLASVAGSAGRMSIRPAGCRAAPRSTFASAVGSPRGGSCLGELGGKASGKRRSAVCARRQPHPFRVGEFLAAVHGPCRQSLFSRWLGLAGERRSLCVRRGGRWPAPGSFWQVRHRPKYLPAGRQAIAASVPRVRTGSHRVLPPNQRPQRQVRHGTQAGQRPLLLLGDDRTGFSPRGLAPVTADPH